MTVIIIKPLQCQSIVWQLFRDKHQNLMRLKSPYTGQCTCDLQFHGDLSHYITGKGLQEKDEVTLGAVCRHSGQALALLHMA